MSYLKQSKITAHPALAQIIAPLIFTLTLALLPRPILAQSTLSIVAIPPQLEITAQPGEVVTETIKVRNESTQDQPIEVKVKDIIVKDNLGTPVTVDPTHPNRWAAAPWIQVSPTKFDLKRGETKALSVTVIVPEDALPGGHYAVVLHSPQAYTALNQTGSSIEANVGSIIYITVPGDIKEDARVTKLDIPPFSEYGPIAIQTEIENFSDIHVNPAGAIQIYNWFGRPSDTLILDRYNIFPYTSRVYENLLNRKWLFGRYKAQLQASYGSTGQALLATVFFWVIPWKLILIALLAITTIIVLILLLKKKREQKEILLTPQSKK
jgi:hypothetical protein